MRPLPPSAFRDVDPLFRDEIEAWVNHGTLPKTEYLNALLRGDLKKAYRHANREQLGLLVPTVRAIERIEDMCWGSNEAVANWLHDGGLTGKAKKLFDYEAGVVRANTLEPPRPRRPKRNPNLPPTQQEIDDGEDDK